MAVQGNRTEKCVLYCLSLVMGGMVTILTHLKKEEVAVATPAPQAKIKAKPIQIETEESDESMQMVIKGRLAEVQECYNTQIKRGLTQTGKLVVKWFVDSQGQSSDFHQEVNELESSELFDCTTTAIQAWDFPKNQSTQIRFTFHMKVLETQRIVEREYTSLE